jgi:deazaflavin-dependent oxidoreductase (nitroreductase family)
VTSLKRRLLHTGNVIGVWIHRASKGRLDSGSKDVHVLMITVPGRRTGLPRSTMVRYLEHDGGYLVWGTGSGSPTEPDWFRNLRQASLAHVEIGTTTRTVTPRVMSGSDRDQVWRDVVLAQVPGVAKYEAKARRTIPVAHLTPVAGADPERST